MRRLLLPCFFAVAACSPAGSMVPLPGADLGGGQLAGQFGQQAEPSPSVGVSSVRGERGDDEDALHADADDGTLKGKDEVYGVVGHGEAQDGQVENRKVTVDAADAGGCTSDGLIAHWTFDEGAGVTVADSADDHAGTLAGGAGYTSGPSQVSSNLFALNFDGADDEVVISGEDTADFNFGTSEFTISLWTKLGTGAADRSVLGHFAEPGRRRGWALRYYNDGRVNFVGYGNNGNNDNAFASSILDDQWHNVAGVYHRSGDNLIIETYVDGVLIGASPTVDVGSINVSADMMLGHSDDQPNFLGDMDEVRVYDRALDSSEVFDLSTGCDEGSGGTEGGSDGGATGSTGETGGDTGSETASNQEEPSDAVSSNRPGGGHRGDNTNVFTAAAQFVIENNQGAFGGGPDPRICSMQRKLADDATLDVVREVAEVLADVMDISVDEIIQLVMDPTYCNDLNASIRPPKPVAQSAKPIAFYVNASGLPVSRGNPVFDLCIGGRPVPLQMIKNNPHRMQANHRGDITRGATCGDYYLGDGRWKHPDHPELEYFTFSPKPYASLTLPFPYVVTHQSLSAGQKYERRKN